MKGLPHTSNKNALVKRCTKCLDFMMEKVFGGRKLKDQTVDGLAHPEIIIQLIRLIGLVLGR